MKPPVDGLGAVVGVDGNLSNSGDATTSSSAGATSGGSGSGAMTAGVSTGASGSAGASGASAGALEEPSGEPKSRSYSRIEANTFGSSEVADSAAGCGCVGGSSVTTATSAVVAGSVAQSGGS